MSSIFSFLRPPSGSGEQPPPSLPASASPALLPPGTGHAGLVSSLDQVPEALLAVLRTYLPQAAPPLPDPTVAIASLNFLPLSIGNWRGIERRGPWETIVTKGGRLDALVRFQLWGNDIGQVDAAMTSLQGRLLAARDNLWADGVLRMVAETGALAQNDAGLGAWFRTADYRVLYEFHYLEGDEDLSLIARISIHSDPEVPNSLQRETTVVTDELARWDNLAAPALGLRGRLAIGRLEALAFIPGAAPSGAITLLRTFDGASGPPVSFPSLADFLAAVAGTNPSERHAQVTFASLGDFLAEFAPNGDPIPLGDWDEAGGLDSYQASTLSFDPPIRLAGARDRLEITPATVPLDQVSVIYLRAKPS